MKVLLGAKAVVLYLRLKLKYRKRIKMKWKNSIRGSFNISVADKASIIIGDFLMSMGPLYLRASENGCIDIGNNVFFNHNCSITAKEKVQIGNNSIFGNNVVIVDHNHKIGKIGIENGYNTKTITIGSNVWIGANVTILKGVKIGDGSVIAAGATVITDVPAHEIWGEVPARCLKKI